ncbi:MAG: hypothetical protein QOH96_3030 [Blastocatellia bacterium]|nr:hypothetical protein [Blastocatellia bacterium]
MREEAGSRQTSEDVERLALLCRPESIGAPANGEVGHGVIQNRISRAFGPESWIGMFMFADISWGSGGGSHITRRAEIVIDRSLKFF